MKRNYVYVAVISCVILLAGSLAGCQNTVQQEPKVEQVQESTRIDSGMLVTYDGENTELTVSDTVTKVDADLFKETKSPEEVTHIVLGAGVEEISPTAFDGFTELRSVTVPKENKDFCSFTDDARNCTYLCGVDKPIVFCFPGKESGIVMTGSTDAPYFYGLGTSVDFVCNGAVFTIQAEKDYDDAIRWYCSSMRHGEHTLAFRADEEFQGGNYEVNILRTASDDIVFQRKSGCSADVYILTSSGDRVDSDSWGVNGGALSFYLGEDSELRYEKIGYDYCDFEQYASCPGGIDGNATYSEEGVASVVNGKLVLTADKTCTVSDYWNMRGTNG